VQESVTWLKSRSKLWVVGAGLMAMTIVGVIDFLAGPGNEVPILYVLVVVIVAWHAGRAAGVSIAVIGTAAVSLASLRFPVTASQVWSGAWSAVMGLAVFLILALLAARTRSLQDQLKGKVRELIKAIEECQNATDIAQTTRTKLGAYVDTAVDGIVTVDDHGIIDTFNPAAERIFGYHAHEIIGQNMRLLVPPPYRDEHDRYIRDYLRTGQRKVIGSSRQLFGQRKDGSLFPMELAVGEVQLGNRRLFTGTVRDITQRRQLEKEVLEISDQERQRIAQDLHDGLCQHLTATEFASQVLAEELTEASLPQAAEVKRISTYISQAITQAHEIARGLQPLGTAPGGLGPALSEMSAMVQTLFHVHCIVKANGSTALLDQAQVTHTYRIAQEAVTNAIKHGKASEVLIEFSDLGDQIVLTVQDNGVGLPSEPGASKGMGIRTMNYRAHLIGATLEMQRRPNGGTRVALSIPKNDRTAMGEGA